MQNIAKVTYRTFSTDERNGGWLTCVHLIVSDRYSILHHLIRNTSVSTLKNVCRSRRSPGVATMPEAADLRYEVINEGDSGDTILHVYLPEGVAARCGSVDLSQILGLGVLRHQC